MPGTASTVTEKMHGHSFTIVTYIGMKDQSEDIPFFKLEAIAGVHRSVQSAFGVGVSE